ncbi:MAG: ABC transporter [Rhodospirillaceae bacterium]|nr:ABC transporter [Rhodospirillaceae bacterium]|tara:strand:+ start:385 stop:1209 length:825 start_codon:yes stop_codon:yes gene_type:complete
MGVFLDPLFRTQLVTGLLIVLFVPLLGPYLRMRGEWLAALGYCHVAAAGAVFAVLIPGVPPMLTAAGSAAAMAAGKSRFPRAGNDIYGLAILLAWSAMILVMANSPFGRMIGESLIDGQLYFANLGHLIIAAMLAVAVLAALYALSDTLLRDHLFPGQQKANRQPIARHHLMFDVLTALALGLAASAMGIMAAFALVFLPAWLSFEFARSWRQGIVITSAISLVGYLVAFWLAMALDQPFGPSFIAVLLALMPAGLVHRLWRRRTAAEDRGKAP